MCRNVPSSPTMVALCFSLFHLGSATSYCVGGICPTLHRVIEGTVKPLITDPPKSGQPLYKGQRARPQCVLCSEVLL